MRKALLTLMLFVGSAAYPAESTRLIAGAASTVILEGSSNVTGWRCTGTSMEAEMSIAATADHINNVIDRIEDGNIGIWMSDPSQGRFPVPDFHLRVPVTSFRCGNRIMESDMRRALRADAYPQVEFSFHALRGGIQHDIDAGSYRAAISGNLSLAGRTRTVDVVVSAQRTSRTTFRIRTTMPLQMSDFGVTPPTALFGAIRARNDLTVTFDLTLAIAPEPRARR